MQPEITIVLTVNELDYVGNCLAARPYSEVNGLIAKIMNQANAKPANILPDPVLEPVPLDPLPTIAP